MAASWQFCELFRALEAYGNRPAVLMARGAAFAPISGAELLEQARRLAVGIAAAGVAPGDPVALVGPNSPGWVTCWLGLAWAGAVPVGLDDDWDDTDIAIAVADAGCALVFAHPRHHGAFAAQIAGGGLAVFTLDGDGADDDEGGETGHPPPWTDLLAATPAPPVAREAGDPQVMVYTSGTTGAPKSFELSRANIAANVGAVLSEGLLGEGDRVLLPLPLHHVYPLVVGMLSVLASGACMVLPAAATAQEIGDALRGARPTVMIGVPRLYAALAEGIARRARARGVVSAALFATLKAVARPLRRFGPGTGRTLFRPVHRAMGGRLRFMVSGGAQLEPAIVHDLDTLGFEVLTGYGLAETASLFTGNRPGAKRIGTEGRPLADGEVRIAFDAENAAAEEGIGEIQLKGASVFAGYRGPAATDRDSFTADGWFRTGDLGRLDDDGYLVVTGRCKEVLVLGGGKNVIPEPLERHYGEAPGLREIAVLEHNGQLVALAVPDIGALRAEGKTSTEDALRIELTARGRSLPPYQRLAGFAISRVPLPRNRLGKYRRFLLPKLFEDAHAARPGPRALSAEDRALVSGGAGAIAWAVLVERFAVRGLDMDADPRLDLGMDSLEWMNISMELERRLGARLDDQTVAGVETVRELVLEAIAAHDRGGGAVAAHPAEDSPQWIAPRRKPERVTAALLRAVNRALMRALFRLRVEGVAPLAGVKGGTVIVANHASDLDPALLMAALPSEVARRCWWGVDAGRLAESGVIRAVCRVFPVFPVDERAPQTALDLARQVLGRGDCLAWFPESWRSPDGTVQRFLQGIGAVLEGRAVTVVPAYIAGSFEVMARDRRWPRLRPVRVRFGEPVAIETLAREGSGNSARERIVDALRRRVMDLAPGDGNSLRL